MCLFFCCLSFALVEFIFSAAAAASAAIAGYDKVMILSIIFLRIPNDDSSFNYFLRLSKQTEDPANFFIDVTTIFFRLLKWTDDQHLSRSSRPDWDL